VVLLLSGVLISARGEGKGELEKAKSDVKKSSAEKGLAGADVNRAVAALEEGVKKGLPVDFALDIVKECIGQGLNGEGIEKVSRDVWATVEKDKDKADFETLGSQVKELLKRGLRGTELANAIHQKIAERHRAKIAEKEARKEVKKESIKGAPKPVKTGK